MWLIWGVPKVLMSQNPLFDCVPNSLSESTYMVYIILSVSELLYINFYILGHKTSLRLNWKPICQKWNRFCVCNNLHPHHVTSCSQGTQKWLKSCISKHWIKQNIYIYIHTYILTQNKSIAQNSEMKSVSCLQTTIFYLITKPAFATNKNFNLTPCLHNLLFLC